LKVDSYKSIEAVITPILATSAVACAIIGWVYRTASARLGIVDLFAYEITTLCRVGTIVDAARRYIAAAESSRSVETARASTKEGEQFKPVAARAQGLAHSPYRFDSAENYFPVFESNSRDLRVLEAGVVTNVTAFYTYMKVVRDYLRRAADLDSGQHDKNELHQAWVNVIYMLFLAYEAARKSINDLIEYEPTHAENTVVILLTEIAAYGFLQRNFAKKPDEIWSRRLNLRAQEYRDVANGVYYKISRHPRGSDVNEKEWAKAGEFWTNYVSGAAMSALYWTPTPLHVSRSDFWTSLSGVPSLPTAAPWLAESRA